MSEVQRLLSELKTAIQSISITLPDADLEIGAVELKDATTSARAAVANADPGSSDYGLIVRTVGLLSILGATSGAAVITDANGTLQQYLRGLIKLAITAGGINTKEMRAGTGTQSSVASSASDVTVLAANANRLGATIFNDSSAVLYLLLASGTSSATNHSVQIPAGGYYEVPALYTGIIKGIWASANGSTRVTELT